jgi:hypothetical protein
MKANESRKSISLYQNSRQKQGNVGIFLKEKAFNYNKKEQSACVCRDAMHRVSTNKIISMFNGTLVSSDLQLYSIIDL